MAVRIFNRCNGGGLAGAVPPASFVLEPEGSGSGQDQPDFDALPRRPGSVIQ
jgi:hypothetical protein